MTTWMDWATKSANGGALGDPGNKTGRGDRIRTCDILLPKQALYQTELRLDCTSLPLCVT